jgi:hypothetical protein
VSQKKPETFIARMSDEGKRMKIQILVFSLFFGSIAFAQSTPQKYCESLAASSCEVLNIENHYSMGLNTSAVGYGGQVHIKYCRNQVLKAITWGRIVHNVHSAPYTSSGNYNEESLYRYYQGGYGLTALGVNIALTNSALCGNGTVLP